MTRTFDEDDDDGIFSRVIYPPLGTMEGRGLSCFWHGELMEANFVRDTHHFIADWLNNAMKIDGVANLCRHIFGRGALLIHSQLIQADGLCKE